jgi:ribonucleotide monophosphatase NagD (HAD superfamily)
MSKTIFIDLDGTLVIHNYKPLIVSDVFLPGATDFLINAKAQNCYCILTTNRSKENSQEVISYLLSEHNFKFDREIYDLPVGIRYLINDNKDDEVRAIAIPLERNLGLINISI